MLPQFRINKLCTQLTSSAALLIHMFKFYITTYAFPCLVPYIDRSWVSSYGDELSMMQHIAL